VTGTDATEAFYNLHRQEVLQKYSKLCIGQIEGEQSKVIEQQPGDLSVIPYGELTWFTWRVHFFVLLPKLLYSLVERMIYRCAPFSPAIRY
jgi:hypothetical protein